MWKHAHTADEWGIAPCWGHPGCSSQSLKLRQICKTWWCCLFVFWASKWRRRSDQIWACCQLESNQKLKRFFNRMHSCYHLVKVFCQHDQWPAMWKCCQVNLRQLLRSRWHRRCCPRECICPRWQWHCLLPDCTAFRHRGLYAGTVPGTRGTSRNNCKIKNVW